MPPTPYLPLTISLLTLPPLLFTTYLYNQPLPRSQTRQIKSTTTLAPSVLSSPTHHLINPKNHTGMTDTLTFVLPRNHDYNELSDSQLLSRLTCGFFAGRVFRTEYIILSCLRAMGSGFLVTGFSGIPPNPRPEITSFSREELPPLYSVYLDRFMVLDSHISQSQIAATPEQEAPQQELKSSYIDIGFGDNRKRFTGFHRFEILRSTQRDEKERGGDVTIRYSCLACDPAVDGWRPWLLGSFHQFYAISLFRDGVREVLSD